MSRMIRKQVYVEAAHEEILKRKAKELGTTESGVIRLGIERLDQTTEAGVLDERAWQEELQFMKERALLRAPTPVRRWTREELHERR